MSKMPDKERLTTKYVEERNYPPKRIVSMKPALWKLVYKHALACGYTVSALIQQACREYLDRHADEANGIISNTQTKE